MRRKRLAAMSRACLERRYDISWESNARKMVEKLVHFIKHSFIVQEIVHIFVTYIPASIHNEAMLSGAWTSIAQ